MADIASLALAGASLGLSAGFSPGPLLTLVLSQTLAHGPREGVKVALAPVLTDAPILLAAWLLLSRAAGHPAVLGVVALAGAALLVRYGWECFKAPPPQAGSPRQAPRSVLRGMAANFANPHPYLFWATIGGPLLLKAGQSSGAAGVVTFLGVFYAAIVGAKVAAAVLAGRFRRFLDSRAYRAVMAVLGLSLLYFAFVFARQGASMLAGA